MFLNAICFKITLLIFVFNIHKIFFMDIEDLHPVPIHFNMKVYEGTNLNKHVPVLFFDGVTLFFF